MKMKKLFLILLLTATSIFSQSQYRLNVNAINLPMDNKGILAAVNIPDPNPIIGGAGGKFGGHVFLFSGGFLLAGYANDTLWANGVAPSSLMQDYAPGTITNEPSDPKNIIYVVKKNDPAFGQSWQDWINAVSLGADFYDGNNDGTYNPTDLNGNNIWDPTEDKPALIADELAWCVYTDKVPASQRAFNTVDPKGIEIQQTICAYGTAQAPLGNTLFIRYRIINTGTVINKLDSVIFAIYADPDLGDAWDDLIGCDTLLNSGYIYNNGNDSEYGNTPPAFFMKYLQGPVSYNPGVTFIDNNSNGLFDDGIDTPLDTAYNRRGDLFSTEYFPGAKNLGLSANILMRGGDPTLTEPSNPKELWNYLNGLTRTGNIFNPCDTTFGYVAGGINCTQVNPFFWFSGDPVGNIGWINNSEDDLRNIISSGRFTLEVNRPIDIWVGYIVGQGTSALNSVTVTRNYVQNAQAYFNNNFTNGTVSDVDDFSIVTGYNLYQNFPNPFNPSTKIIWQSPVAGHQTLKVFDVLGNEVATLVNEFRNAGSFEIDFNASQLASGIYFYRLSAGSFVQTKKMILLK
jgi:hypothetical protein